jgi:hypothetical protein
MVDYERVEYCLKDKNPIEEKDGNLFNFHFLKKYLKSVLVLQMSKDLVRMKKKATSIRIENCTISDRISDIISKVLESVESLKEFHLKNIRSLKNNKCVKPRYFFVSF